MGCFWSSEASSRARCRQCRRRAVNNLVIKDDLCEICTSKKASRLQQLAARPRQPLYGEYKCACGRFWSSRLSWPDYYQICYRCRNRVHARVQRILRPSDMTNTKDNVQEHRKDLCQMCQQLGHYCGGNFGEKKQTHRKRYRTE